MKKHSFKERSNKLMLKLLSKMIYICDEPLHNVNKREKENS